MKTHKKKKEKKGKEKRKERQTERKKKKKKRGEMPHTWKGNEKTRLTHSLSSLSLSPSYSLSFLFTLSLLLYLSLTETSGSSAIVEACICFILSYWIFKVFSFGINFRHWYCTFFNNLRKGRFCCPRFLWTMLWSDLRTCPCIFNSFRFIIKHIISTLIWVISIVLNCHCWFIPSSEDLVLIVSLFLACRVWV